MMFWELCQQECHAVLVKWQKMTIHPCQTLPAVPPSCLRSQPQRSTRMHSSEECLTAWYEHIYRQQQQSILRSWQCLQSTSRLQSNNHACSLCPWQRLSQMCPPNNLAVPAGALQRDGTHCCHFIPLHVAKQRQKKLINLAPRLLKLKLMLYNVGVLGTLYNRLIWLNASTKTFRCPCRWGVTVNLPKQGVEDVYFSNVLQKTMYDDSWNPVFTFTF